jgi:RsiW-degrading membrane proteinase PrsW (M82 family)
VIGIWILILLILISSLPVLAAYVCLRLIRFPVNMRWFFGSLAAGAAAVILAGFLQSFFPPSSGMDRGALFFNLFIQVALTEELGRLVFLLLFLWFYRRFFVNADPNADPDTVPFKAAAGFITGLGFAAIETAVYGAANPGSALLRALIAAPLHGACGCRVGLAAAYLRDSPLRALLFFIYAVAIHGMYNFLVMTPDLPPVFPILLVFAALLSAFKVIRRGRIH